MALWCHVHQTLGPLPSAANGIILVAHETLMAERRQMREQMTRRKAGTSQIRVPHKNLLRRATDVAFLVLLIALAVVLVKDHDFWFGSDQTPAATAGTSPATRPNAVAAKPAAPNAAALETATPVPSAPSAKPKKHVASQTSAAQTSATQTSTRPAVAGSPVTTTTRAVMPSRGIEPAAGHKRGRTVPAVSNSLKVEMLSSSGSQAPSSTASQWGPATPAAERVQMSPVPVQQPRQTVDLSRYPLLSQQMKVQGSVQLQAIIGADGVIRELRILSGPAILAPAAREAVRKWRFKPYLQNGQPVESTANITVNLTMDVLDKEARNQLAPAALSSNGE
jgi:TonB family protein